MRSFSDIEHARALAVFPPAHATAGASNAAEGVYEAIMIDAALKGRLLPSVRAAIAGQTQTPGKNPLRWVSERLSPGLTGECLAPISGPGTPLLRVLTHRYLCRFR